MKHEFEAVTDAASAGYNYASERLLETYREYKIRIVDTSGYGSFGYKFSVKALPDGDLIRAGHQTLGPFASTVTVWTQDLNQLRQPGSFRPMFMPGALDAAIAGACAAVDACFDE